MKQTAVEKAKELFYNFYEIHSDNIYFGMNKEMAKKSALIAVDEVINSMTVATSVHLPYWQEVKQEIVNL